MAPVAGVTSKTMLWSWREVSRWLLEKGKLTDPAIYDKAVTLKQLNESLDIRHNESHLKNLSRITKLLNRKRGELA